MRRAALVAFVWLSACGGDSSDIPDSATLPGGPFSDDFSGGALDARWRTIGVGTRMATPVVAGGALALTMTAAGLWYQDGKGGLVYQLVTGNFRVTATVHARSTSNPSLPPAGLIQLGGLMARDPAGDGGAHEDFVHIVTGNDDQTLHVVETKTTVAGVSTWQSSPGSAAGDAVLRVCRVGADFYLYVGGAGGGFAQAAHYTRADLPATLEVGPSIYDGGSPDITVSFDEVRFAAAPAGAADCATP